MRGAVLRQPFPRNGLRGRVARDAPRRGAGPTRLTRHRGPARGMGAAWLGVPRRVDVEAGPEPIDRSSSRATLRRTSSSRASRVLTRGDMFAR